jgi:hypothetical protein
LLVRLAGGTRSSGVNCRWYWRRSASVIDDYLNLGQNSIKPQSWYTSKLHRTATGGQRRGACLAITDSPVT